MYRSFLVMIVPLVAACDGGDTTDQPVTETGEAGLAIVGHYVDGFGTTHDITEESWSQQFGSYPAMVFEIAAYDDGDAWVVARNADDNGYFPGLWSRFDWLELDGHLYYCQSAFDAASQADAEALARPDDADPTTAGCGGFSWTDLTP